MLGLDLLFKNACTIVCSKDYVLNSRHLFLSFFVPSPLAIIKIITGADRSFAVGSLEVLLLFGVEAEEDFGLLNKAVSRDVVDRQGEERNSATEVELDFVLPLRVSSAVIHQRVVGSESLFDIADHVGKLRASTRSVHGEGVRRVVRRILSLDHIQHLIQLGCVLKDRVDLLVVPQFLSGLLKVGKFLLGESRCVLIPFLLELCQSGHWFKIGVVLLLVILTELVERLANEHTLVGFGT